MIKVARINSAFGLTLGSLIVVIATVLITLRVVGAGAGAGASRPGDGASGADVAGSSSSFTISGRTVESISPGVMAPLDLAFTNHSDLPMSISEIRVTVKAVSAPKADDVHPCAIGDFTVSPASSNLEVTASARATSTLSTLSVPQAQWPQVGMLNRSVNQNGCKAAVVTLGYAASGSVKK